MYRVWIIGLAVSLGVVQGHLALAVVSGSAPEHVERGYALVAQARLEAESATRERLLSGAIAAFKEAYQSEPTDPPSQVQALLGAAQAYLLVQSPRRVFPFLWQATPLQRAEKSLQQALVLQPDNAAAALLLGVVYWRQAAQARGQQQDALERSQYYLTQAAGLGIPLRLSSDARGIGRMDDLIFVYRLAASEPIFGVVVVARQAYPLALDIATGALALHGLLEAITTLPQPGKQPILVMRLRQGTQSIDTRFIWDGARFVSLSPLP